jgi:hypothetical protein
MWRSLFDGPAVVNCMALSESEEVPIPYRGLTEINWPQRSKFVTPKR